MSRIRSSFALLGGCAVALGFGGTAALAADMGLPTKAPMAAAAAPPPLAISGFAYGQWESTLINPQGQVLGTHGAESLAGGLNWTVYKGGAWLNSWTIGGLLGADFIDGFDQGGYWASFNPSLNGHFFDFFGQVNTSFTFWNAWTLRESFTMVTSQDVAGVGSPRLGIACNTPVPVNGSGGCGGFAPLPINELRLTYNDASWGWPVTFNPYVEWYYDFGNINSNSVGSGAQTPACFTCGPNKSDFWVGIDLTWNASKWWGIPLTFKVPTYVTLGPENFWTGGAGNPVGAVVSFANGGPVAGTVGNDGIVGMFTTGLTAIYDLKWIPAQYGGWYIRGGFQYYDLINNNLVLSEVESVNKSNRNIWVGFVGAGVHF